MLKRNKIVIWIGVLIIDFLLINAGLEGWFFGYASHSFASLFKELVLTKYIESLIVPIILLIAVFLLTNIRFNTLNSEQIKKNLPLFLLTIIFLSQGVTFFYTKHQINTINYEIRSVNNAIGNDFPIPRLFGYSSSISSKIGDINNKLEQLSSNIEYLTIEVTSLHR